MMNSSDVFTFKDSEAPVEGIDIIDFDSPIKDAIIETIPARIEGFKGIESEYVSLSQDFLETQQEEIDRENLDFEKYLLNNREGIRAEDREMLEDIVVKGIPTHLRR